MYTNERAEIMAAAQQEQEHVIQVRTAFPGAVSVSVWAPHRLSSGKLQVSAWRVLAEPGGQRLGYGDGPYGYLAAWKQAAAAVRV